MRIVITGNRRIEAARIGGAVVNGIVPVVIVIGVLSVPAAVMRLERVMRPAHSRVSAGNDNILPGIPERPYLGSASVPNSRLDQLRLRRLFGC